MDSALNPFEASTEAHARVADLRRAFERSEHGLRAVVVGAGKSGQAAADLLRERQVQVTIVDDRPSHPPIEAKTIDAADLVVLSPGVPRRRPELASSILRGTLVGEVELATWFLRVPLIGITGTNGKSTTTALVGHILASAGRRPFVGGNLGRPLSELVTSGEECDVAVVELSSYQLESIVDATFDVACWLNLTPDHADRYDNLEAYAAAKRRLLERRSVRGIGVVNAKDRYAAQAAIELGGHHRWFSVESRSDLADPNGTLLDSFNWARRTVLKENEFYNLDNPALVGLHNRANMCAAIECARHVDVSVEAVQAGLLSFRGLPHRIELVGEKGGVRWYNDSKATNVDSALIALRAISSPKILIAGGRDKGAPWEPLRSEAHGIKAVLAIGEATPLVLFAFTDFVPRVESCGTLERAMERAQSLASAGDAVLLSPACASFDQFENYERRGDRFRELVQEICR